jgi:hypothetical protein
MAINRIDGTMLEANLLRQGDDFAVETDLLYFDVGNGRIGIQTSGPTQSLEVVGGATVDNLSLTTNTLSSVNTDGNIIITPNGTGTIELNKDINVNASDLTLANLPTADFHAAPKQYVDSVAQGLDFKSTVHMATVSNLAATYNNGTAGVGATLTASVNGVLPPSVTDNHAHYDIGTRILVKLQTDATENGIYTLTNTGTGEEVTEVTTLADVSNSLDGKYFQFADATTTYHVWYNTSGGAATDPAPGGSTAIEVAIATNALVADVTAATISAINLSAAAVTAYLDEDNIFFIVDDATGVRTDAADTDTGFTISITIQGTASPTAWVLTRATDADESTEVSGGMFVFIEDGATLAITAWVLASPVGPATIGTDDLVFIQFADLSVAGDVFKVGVPVDNEIGVWTGDGTIEGDTNFQWTGTALDISGDIIVDSADRIRLDGSAAGDTAIYEVSSNVIRFLAGNNDALDVRPEGPHVKGGILMTERADHSVVPAAGFGEIWVRSDTPNVLMFTDDAGTDWVLNDITGVDASGTPLNDQVAVFTDANTIEGDATFTYSGTTLAAAGFTLDGTADSITNATSLTIGITGLATRQIFTGTNQQWYVASTQVANSTSGSFNFLIGVDMASNLVLDGTLRLTERADHVFTPAATRGELWLRNDSKLIFTDGAGTDIDLTDTGGNVSNTGTPVNDQLAVWTDATTIEGSANLTYTATAFTAGNYTFNTDQTVGAGQDNYVLVYDNGTGEIQLENVLFVAVGGSNSQMQYNNGGLLDGASPFTYDDAAAGSGGQAFTINSLTTTANGLNISGDQQTSGVTLNVSANNATKTGVVANFLQDNATSTAAVIQVTQDGTGDMLTMFDGVTEAFTINQVGKIDRYGGAATTTNRQALISDGTDIELRLLVEADISDLGSYAVISGTPVNNQLAVWTSATDVEGAADLLWDGAELTMGSVDTATDVIARAGNAGGLTLSGGTSATAGARITMRGGTHATLADDMAFGAGSDDDWMFWDDDVGSLTISTAVGATKTAALTLDASQDATFGSNIGIGGNTPITTTSNNVWLDATSFVQGNASGNIAQIGNNIYLDTTWRHFDENPGSVINIGPGAISNYIATTPAVVAATALVGSTEYRILTIGTTDFTLVGAASNTVGLLFTASGAGTGTGTASEAAATFQLALEIDTTSTEVIGELSVSDAHPNRRLRITADGTDAVINYANNASLKLQQNSADRITLNNSAEVLINTGGRLVAGDNSATTGASVIEGNYSGLNRALVLGSMRSSGATALMHNVRPDAVTNDGFESSNALASNQQAFTMDGTNGFRFLIATSATPAIGTDVAMTEYMHVDSAGIDVTGNIIVSGTVDGVDIAARDHDAVTFTGTGTYISLSGQQITVDQITQSDISDVTATASELNLLDLAGLTAGWILSADSATTASWKANPGGGNVSNTGTPVNNQLAVWTDATTIEGEANLTYDGTTFTVNDDASISGTIATTLNGDTLIGTGTQAADGDHDVILFSDAAGTAAQSGAFRSALRLYGGASQTRTLEFYQVESGNATIDTSFGSNILDINSFASVSFNAQNVTMTDGNLSVTQTAAAERALFVTSNTASRTAELAYFFQQNATGGGSTVRVLSAAAGDAINVTANNAGGRCGYFYSNVASRTVPVLEVINDNATGSGTALKIQQDQGGAAIDLDLNSSSSTGLDIDGPGQAININNTGSGTTGVVLNMVGSLSTRALDIDFAGNGSAVDINCTNSSAAALVSNGASSSVTAHRFTNSGSGSTFSAINSATSGSAAIFSKNVSGNAASVVQIINDHVTGAADALEVRCDGTGKAISATGNVEISGDLDPTVTNTQDIGQSGLVWANVWATTFEGTATTAQYADLAEKYLTDAEYEVGTVLMFGGEQEVTEATPSTTAIAGIVSEKPAFLMNKKLANSATVALRGRVPCKVYGPVAKGDLMVAGTGGVAVADNNANPNAVLGRAIATNDDGYGYIEVVV